MGCAGCDECPPDAWHLHVTVNRFYQDSDKPVEYVSVTGFGIDMDNLGLKPVSVTNIMENSEKSYRELIPTLHFRGTEMEAVRALFDMGCRLNRLGWRPLRLKIEGDYRTVPVGRVLYYESHVKYLSEKALATARERKLPFSIGSRFTNVGNLTVTVRHKALGQVHELASDLAWPATARIEACVLDTAQELDEKWMAQ